MILDILEKEKSLTKDEIWKLIGKRKPSKITLNNKLQKLLETNLIIERINEQPPEYELNWFYEPFIRNLKEYLAKKRSTKRRKSTKK